MSQMTVVPDRLLVPWTEPGGFLGDGTGGWAEVFSIELTITPFTRIEYRKVTFKGVKMTFALEYLEGEQEKLTKIFGKKLAGIKLQQPTSRFLNRAVAAT